MYKLADDENLLLCDTKDLKAILQFASENAAALESEYGRIAKQSVAAIVRAIVALEGEGADRFFGEPAINVADFFTTDPSGKGSINVLDSSSLINQPRLYSAFMLYLLSELFEVLPEVGDMDKPRVVFFFDEAHLLFDSASSELMEKIEQMIKLIRSKGVGVYFITQSPGDIPDAVASQLGNKIEHGLRAYTPAERKVLKAAAESFRENPAFDTMELLAQLGTGEAVVSMLDEKGVPGVAQHVWVLPPESYMGLLDDARRDQAVKTSNLYLKYSAAADPDSAFEFLERRKQQQAQQEAAEKAQEQAEKERLAAEKQAAKELKKEQERERRGAGARRAERGLHHGGHAGPPAGRHFGQPVRFVRQKAGRQRGGQHWPQPAGHAVQALNAAAVHLLHERKGKRRPFLRTPFAFGERGEKPPVFPFGRRLRLYCRGNMAANREMRMHPRRGGFHIRPVCGGRGLREGHAPPLHGIRARPAKWDCRGRPGERRAGCPHPAGPRGAANARGRDLRPKSRRCAAVGLRNAPAGAVNPAPTANGRSAAKREPRVITNLCRGRCLHRPEGPPRRRKRPRAGAPA